jgi:hypothetical protein
MLARKCRRFMRLRRLQRPVRSRYSFAERNQHLTLVMCRLRLSVLQIRLGTDFALRPQPPIGCAPNNYDKKRYRVSLLNYRYAHHLAHCVRLLYRQICARDESEDKRHMLIEIHAVLVILFHALARPHQCFVTM